MMCRCIGFILNKTETSRESAEYVFGSVFVRILQTRFWTISAAVEDQPPLPPTDVLLVSFSLFGSFSLLKQLQNQIAQHSKSQENDCGDDLCGDVHPCTICGIPKYEPYWLPEPVVGEGCLLVVGKENAVERIDLGLPDRVADPPEDGQGVDDWKSFDSWSPGEHCSESSGIDESSNEEDRNPTNSFGDKAAADGDECVGSSVGNHNFTKSS